MSDTTSAARINSIERELRLWRVTFLAALVFVTLISATQQATRPTESISTKELLLVDNAGQVRGHLGVLKDGPALTFLDKDGKVNILLSGSTAEPGLSILHGDQFVAGMFQWKGEPRLALANKKGDQSLTLSVDSRGPLLAMCGADSEPARLTASVYDNSPLFALKNPQGQNSVMVGEVGNAAMIALPGLDPKTDAGVSIVRDGSKAYVEVDHAGGGFAQLGTVGFADRENNPIESPFPVLAIFNANGDTIFNSTALTDLIKGFAKSK